LYQLSDGLFHPAASVPRVETDFILGGDLLIQYAADNLVAYDLSDPSAPVEVAFPYEDTFIPTNIATSPGMMYLSNGESLWSIRADDLENFEIVSKEDDFTNAHYQSPLLSKYDRAQRENAQFSYLSPEGEILSEFNAPAIENDIGYERYDEPLWNDHLLIQPVIVDETVPPNVNSDEYPFLYLYELNQAGISETAAASIKIPTRNTRMSLGNSEIFVAYDEVISINTPPFIAHNSYITPYAITQNHQFEALSEFVLTENNPDWIATSQMEYDDGWLAVLGLNSLYLVDASDPSQLKQVSEFHPSGSRLTSMKWHEGRLYIYSNLEGILVLEITDSNELSLIGTIPISSINYSISGSRMYNLERSGEVGVYEMQFDGTPVPDWTLY
ncbi:hypothetical protein K8I31_16280, partial [bacterium]|nr:hypothetical protein [bacterium]